MATHLSAVVYSERLWHVDAIAVLVQLGANTEARDAAGATPQKVSVRFGQTQATQALRELERTQKAAAKVKGKRKAKGGVAGHPTRAGRRHRLRGAAASRGQGALDCPRRRSFLAQRPPTGGDGESDKERQRKQRQTQRKAEEALVVASAKAAEAQRVRAAAARVAEAKVGAVAARVAAEAERVRAEASQKKKRLKKKERKMLRRGT